MVATVENFDMVLTEHSFEGFNICNAVGIC